MPAVSIITGTYNSAPFLADYLASLASQTWRDFEAVIVDDGSTDSTVAMLEAAAASDPRLRMIRKLPGGNPAASRQAAVAAATGEWLAFLDHDDVWVPQKLELQLKAMARHPDAVMGHAGRFVFSGAPDQRRQQRYDLGGMPVDCRPARHLYDGNVVTFSSCLMRRATFQALGGLDPDPALRGVDDYDLWLRLPPGATIVHIPWELAGWRDHGSNLGHDRDRMARGLRAIHGRLVQRGAPPEAIAALDFKATKSAGIVAIPDNPSIALSALGHAFALRPSAKLAAIMAFAALNCALPRSVRAALLGIMHKR